MRPPVHPKIASNSATVAGFAKSPRHARLMLAFLRQSISEGVSCTLVERLSVWPEPHSVAATEPGIEKHVQPNAFARTNRPAALVGGDLFFSPHGDACVLWSSWISNAGSGISLDQLCICSPSKEPAHRFEEMPRLSWCHVSTIATCDNCGARDLREWLAASGLNDMREYGFALLPRRK